MEDRFSEENSDQNFMKRDKNKKILVYLSTKKIVYFRKVSKFLEKTERGNFMPKVILHVDGTTVEQEVKDNANLVVLAATRLLPKLKYGCGMGRCTKCTCQVINGAEDLAPPNWKEVKMLGDKVNEGYRLTCQLTIQRDIEISQENISVQAPKKQSAIQN